MKNFLIFFTLILFCLSLKLEEDSKIIEIHLNEEMNRKEYTINLN